MYKVIFKLMSNRKSPNSIRTFTKTGFIITYYRKNGNIEEYTTLYRTNDINELKEAITDLAYLLSKQGKYGTYDFARIYMIKDEYVGKIAGGGLGAALGYTLGGLGGLVLGTLGGILLGELVDVELGETFIGVIAWPIELKY
ncbi:hypothetical protein SUSAZ_00530 [Sulfolobus acidocaldarius SUSAZ]|nr:hypothetical protein SUSAZ_00530 [Sulfolobus acidocaldarius SUSAZ]